MARVGDDAVDPQADQARQRLILRMLFFLRMLFSENRFPLFRNMR
jgi:hypothetical protein